ncbi:DUF7312 domain-containing protein [Natrialba swarupiae]|uniref:DUF7312 domain-containing protein n=1 Tax=Natrialba swarupiae TaxID=2448032 RepID=A0A5D5APM9_9EURY|nr:hypothetical protein [Natrialba swarupiae]TYT62877.1 hypothetical protein FYC77_06070 [Natrialba swarupiae]
MADDSSGVDDETGPRGPDSEPDVFGSRTDTESGWDRDSEEWDGSTTDGDESDAERERIPIDLSGDPEPDDEEPADDDPYEPEPSSAPVESGDPSLENVLFVLLGVVAMVVVIVRVVSLLV